MMYYKIKKGDKIAVAGLGGLGSMAVKFGVAMGCHVTVISRGTKKKDEAMSILGAHAFVDSTDAESWKPACGSFSHIVDTIAAKHDLGQMMAMLDIDGQLIMVGLCPEPLELSAFSYIAQRKSLVGSLIGGIKETQEMLDYCAANKIYCETEVVKPEQINEAYERAVASDVKYRFSIDCSQL
jgi:alcohol dehydrogenase (NADP+)